MKFHDEYVVWIVIIVVVVIALVYSWGNSKEHLVSQNHWGTETIMSATTGFPNLGKDTGQRDYMMYVGDKLIKDGQCPRNLSEQECANNFGRELFGSLDSAKTYCSTVKCTAIMSSDGPTGKMFIPLTSPLMKTVPSGPDGKAIRADQLPKIILNLTKTQEKVIPPTQEKVIPKIQEKVIPPTSTSATPAIAAPMDPGDSYILKSSLVPCTCTIHSMGCEKHGGGKEFSVAPGDKDSPSGGNSDQGTAENQSGLMRPFSSAFSNQGEPTGFLNSFSAFG
jgi:hypothetical protein